MVLKCYFKLIIQMSFWFKNYLNRINIIITEVKLKFIFIDLCNDAHLIVKHKFDILNVRPVLQGISALIKINIFGNVIRIHTFILLPIINH